jgi:hypothetical protein
MITEIIGNALPRRRNNPIFDKKLILRLKNLRKIASVEENVTLSTSASIRVAT